MSVRLRSTTTLVTGVPITRRLAKLAVPKASPTILKLSWVAGVS